jgi:hypothetical protein
MSRVGAVLAAVAVAAVCGSASGSVARTVVVVRPYSATLHMGRGTQSLAFQLHQPAGVILLYRISAPRGAAVRASTQLPGITVPLRIVTGPSRSCVARNGRVSCTVGEEWCPMPAGTWRVRVDKRAGPAGDVILWFRVGNPRGAAAA